MQPQSLRYPPRADYVDALQNPHLTLVDAALKDGVVECDHMGMPRAISGAFASVFQVRTLDGSRWALKCFCQSVPDQERRYSAITSALKGLSHPALAEFEYQQIGILINGQHLPILKMHWLDGQSLLPWIEHNRFDSHKLRMIAEQLVALVTDLEAAGIAHGDLQHGNLLITGNSQIRLIDYDGMYVPALAGLPACEIGLANYQSPTRNNQHFQPGLDRFAGWIIYASLIALSEVPALWSQLRRDGDEKLLFDASDYRVPQNSPGFTALLGSGNPSLIRLGDILTELAATRIEAIPAVTPLSSTFNPAPSMFASRPSPGLPFWLDPPPITPISPTPSALRADLPPDGSWIHQHLPPLPQRTFRGSTSGLRLSMTLFSLAALTTGLALLPLLNFIAVALSLIALLALLLSYRTHPVQRGAVAARRYLATVRKAHRAVQRSYDATTKQLNKLDAAHQGKTRSFQQARDAAAEDLQRAAAAIDTTLQRRLVDESREIAVIDQSVAQQRASRLSSIRQQHVQVELSKQRIARAPLRGIGSQLCDRLTRNGIESAADFIGYSVTGSQATRNEKTYLRRRTGGMIRIDGIGPKKAATLDAWRLQLTRRAEQTQPKTLSPLQEQQLQRDLDMARLNAKQLTANVKTSAQRQLAAAKLRERTEFDTVDQQERTAVDAYRQSRLTLEQVLAQTQNKLAELQATLGVAGQNVESFALITMTRLLRFVTIGK